MVMFYSDPECTQRLDELRFEESYIEDIYGSTVENAVEVGDVISRVIYIKNNNLDNVLLGSVESESPFMSFVVENPQLGPEEVTPLHVTFSPTLEEIKKMEGIEDPVERQKRKKQLLQSKIRVRAFRVYTP